MHGVTGHAFHQIASCVKSRSSRLRESRALASSVRGSRHHKEVPCLSCLPIVDIVLLMLSYRSQISCLVNSETL